MQNEQFELLMKSAGEGAYISIAVNEDGHPVKGGSIPWERTLSAFNMRTPSIALSAADLQDPSIMAALQKCRVNGCYIYTVLPEYAFLTVMKDLNDLFILHAENMHDLSFLREQTELFMFYLADARLPDLKPLIDLCNAGNCPPGKCFGFRNCSIDDLTALSEIRFVLSELLIWPVEGDTSDRWIPGRKPGIFRFYGSNMKG